MTKKIQHPNWCLHFPKRWFFLVLAGLLIFLTFNRHSKAGLYNYHSEIWADKAGYYSYIPLLFSGGDVTKFPDDIDVKTGNGFSIEPVMTGKFDIDNDEIENPHSYEYFNRNSASQGNQKVKTKYFIGVALLILPFELIAECLEPGDYFGTIHHKIINLAAVFYLLAGFYFLTLVFQFKYQLTTVLSGLLLLLLTTNLLYYGINETAMSHVYSFFLISWLWYLIRFIRPNQFTFFGMIGLGCCLALIVLVRPTGLLFFLFLLVWEAPIRSFGQFKSFLLSRYSCLVLVSFAIMLIPQLIYWKYLTGNFFYFPYVGEGFHFENPAFGPFLIAPNNGLLLFTPVWIFGLLCVLWSNFSNRAKLTWIIMVIFLVYLFSCWWDWTFGCGFGSRSFVEFSVLLMIPFCWFLELQLSNVLKSVILLFFIAINLKLTFSFDECFMGSHNWDWNSYSNLLFGSFK